MNLIKILAKTSYDSDSKMLLRIHITYMDYKSFIYFTAAEIDLQKLNTICITRA